MSAPVLEIRDLWLSLRGVPVLEAIHLTLEEGDYLGLIGPNGGGKTMLLKVILGLVPPDRGSVRLFGEPIERARGRVGYVPQYAQFDSDFPIHVLDVVLMGRLTRERVGRRLRREDREQAFRALEQVNMVDHAHRQIGRMSGGQIQRILVARALAVEPELLLLDEPTASLDPLVGPSIYGLLEKVAHDVTVVLVSHDIGVISQYVKTVACLNRKLYYHHSKTVAPEVIEAVYGCPVDLLAHGHAHRVLPSHGEEG